MRYVVLLRGVNVGGHGKLPMADLRRILTSLGHADVTTYLQSGNAVLTSQRDDVDEMAREIENAISLDLDLSIPVLMRTPADLARVVEANPFPQAAATPSHLHVAFLSSQPSSQRVAAIDRNRFEPDRFEFGERVLYLWYPNGAAATKLNNQFFERHFGPERIIATARNWNTVTKLLSLSSQ
jgi:uncharacterized protein (DUF1697 family)